jgi:hypothetical protein
MEKRINMHARFLALLVAVAMAAPGLATTIELNGSGLAAGSYIFDFQFINGDHTNGNNTATVGGFTTTGVTLDSLDTFGSVTGSNLASSLTLKDGPITEVQEAFTATANPFSATFNIAYTDNYAGPGPGDAFTFTITDASLNPIRSGGDGALLEVDITGPGARLQTFVSDPRFGGFTPEVVTSVPEGGTLGLVFLGSFFTVLLACSSAAFWAVPRRGKSL